MDKPIQEGDLVVVVTLSHCGSPAALGEIFRVTKIRPRREGSRCDGCKQWMTAGPLVTENDRDHYITELSRLKRIPPLDELEGQRTEENLKVPA